MSISPKSRIHIGKPQLRIPKPKKKQRKNLKKVLYSDLLSVTVSQARYGQATHPRLTHQIWKEAEKTGYLDVPTVELRKGKKPMVKWI